MKKMRNMVLAFVALFAMSVNAQMLLLDESHSEVGFSIKHMMISNVKGKFKKFDADIEYNIKAQEFESLKATIDASSIDTGIEKRDNHLRNDDFFHVKKYPNIIFDMKSYESNGKTGVMTGHLTMHGVTKKIKLDVYVNGVIKDFDGNTRVGFTIMGEINRKDFGLNWNKVIEAGGLAVGDTVKIQIELETIQM